MGQANTVLSGIPICLSLPNWGPPLPATPMCVSVGLSRVNLLLCPFLSAVVEKGWSHSKGASSHQWYAFILYSQDKDMLLGTLIVSSIWSVLKPTHYTDPISLKSILDFPLPKSNFLPRALFILCVTKVWLESLVEPITGCLNSLSWDARGWCARYFASKCCVLCTEIN